MSRREPEKPSRSRQKTRCCLLPVAQNGVGRTFALQKFLDQLGAFAWPLMLFAVMYFRGSGDGFADYRRCFALLIVPAAVTLALLLAARHFFPQPENFEPERVGASAGRIADGRKFKLYIAGTGLFALGFMDFSMITMHVSRLSLMPAHALPLLYAGAMAVDAAAALFFGRLYDRRGLGSLVWPTLLSAPFATLVFLVPSWGLYLGAALWGTGMGAQESVLKAAIASLVPRERRSSGYGTFQTVFGICLFTGS